MPETPSANERFAREYAGCMMPNYRRYPICVVRGQGSRVWDADGRSYLDLFPGWGVAGLGHCHPKVADAIARQAHVLLHVANNYHSEVQGRFAETLFRRGGGRQVFFCNSGAEANEGAIKLARLARQGRHKIIAFKESFHGRTFAAISATGTPAYQEGFQPIVPGFSHAAFNDLASVEALADDETCAVLVEPVQGEGGVYPAAPEFLKGLRGLCDRRGMLLIFDEVQTTPARLGEWFGYQYFGVEPDILTSAKAIAGGFPMGVFMARPDIAAFLVPGKHASSFGGNALGCAAGIAAWEAMEEEGIPGHVRRMGGWLDARLEELRAASGGAVKAARRCGFMVGIELSAPAAGVVDACRDRGLLVNFTHDTVVRLLPALNASQAELEEGLGILRDVLKEIPC